LNGIIKPAIADFFNLTVWRADEDNQPGMITDKLINDLFDSDLVIADLSELNPNAFYELGIRHAAAKPTIHMAAAGTKLPFDNLGHRAIFFELNDWNSIEQAKTSLREQCEEALADAFQPSNPVIQALSVKAFRASPKEKDHILADIMERLESIEARQTLTLGKREKPEFPDSAQLSRRYRLENALKNFSRSDLGKKLKISEAQIMSYATFHSDESNYRRVMDALQAGDIERVLKQVSDEIPF